MTCLFSLTTRVVLLFATVRRFPEGLVLKPYILWLYKCNCEKFLWADFTSFLAAFKNSVLSGEYGATVVPQTSIKIDVTVNPDFSVNLSCNIISNRGKLFLV